jgi:predicted  nucleic acid-binding Zn-ribbon protein
MAMNPDKPLLAVETTVDTGAAEQGFADLLMKMSSQSEETKGFLKELTGVIKELVDTVVVKGKEAQDLTEKATESVQKQQQTLQEQLSTIRKETKTNLESIETLYKEYGIKATGSLEQAARNIDVAIRKVKEDAVRGILAGPEAKELLSELEADAAEIYERLKKQKEKGTKEVIGDKLASVGGSLGGATEGLMGSVMSKIPGGALGGGLIGLFLYGIGSLETIRAQAESVGQMFKDTAGQTASDVIDNVQGVGSAMDLASQNMRVNRDQLAGVYSELAKVGLTAEEAGFSAKQLTAAFDGLDASAAGLSQNLGILSVAADKSFNLEVGTTIKQSIQLSRDFGISVQTATEQFIKLRMAAQASGDDMDRYMNSVMSASKGLAQFGIDLGAANKLMEAFRAGDPTTSNVQAAKAMQGVSTMMSNIAGNTGMAAFMAADIVEKRGHLGEYKVGKGEEVDALEARRQLLLGMGKEGKNRIMGDILGHAQDMAREAGGTKAQQEFFLEKTFGVDTVTANMINRLTQTQIKDLQKGGKGGLGDKDLEQLQSGMMSAKERENKFQDAIKKMIESIVNITQGILLGIGSLVALVSAFMGGGDKKRALAIAQQGQDKLFGGVEGMASAMGQMGEGLASSTGMMDSKKSKDLTKSGGWLKKMNEAIVDTMVNGPIDFEAERKYREQSGAMVKQKEEISSKKALQSAPAGQQSSSGGGGSRGGQETVYGNSSYDPASGGIKVEAIIRPETLNSVQRNQQMKQGSR